MHTKECCLDCSFFFSQCNSFFCQNISYQCVTTDEPVEWPVNDDICTDQGLVRNVPVQSCGGGICDFGDWLASPLNGVRTRADTYIDVRVSSSRKYPPPPF